jgi:hypothetical protein
MKSIHRKLQLAIYLFMTHRTLSPKMEHKIRAYVLTAFIQNTTKSQCSKEENKSHAVLKRNYFQVAECSI